MPEASMDSLTRDRLETAAYILRNHAALIMYATSRGEDMATARGRLLRMLATGYLEAANVTPELAVVNEVDVDVPVDRAPSQSMRWHSSLVLLLATLFLCATHVAAKADQDYYKVFDMTRGNFDKDKLHKAYRKLAKQHHPDKNKGNKEAEAKFVEITKAFEVLNDDQKRRIYDQFGADAVDKHMNGGGGGGRAYDFRHAEDIFNSFFGGGFGGGFDDIFGFGGGGHHRQQKRRSPDAKLEMSAPLEAFYKGETIPVEVGRQQLCKSCKGTGAKNAEDVKTCDKCRGKGMETVVQQLAPGFVQHVNRPCGKCSGKGRIIKDSCKACGGQRVHHGPSKLEVRIEPGMPDGATVRFPGMSDEHPETETGDLFVVIRQEPHDTFKRNGPDLYTDVTLTLSEALLGFNKELKHLDGHPVTLTHGQAVTQPDWVQTIKGEGMPLSASPKRRGDLYVKYKVVFPTQLDKEQTALLSKVLRPAEAKDEL